MKKLLAFAIILLLAIAAFDAIAPSEMIVNIAGEEVDGPLGALLGLVFGGVGMLIAALALTCAAVFVGVLFAGLGILMVAGLALLALVLAAVVAPFTLPLLIPVAIIWFFVARNRRQLSV